MNPIKKILKKHPVVLAPMAGVTDWAFRQMVRKFSPENLLFTEMISAEMLVRAPEKELRKNPILNISTSDQPIIMQIFGHKPETIYKACEYLKTKKPTAIDLNMGCPVPKIVNNGDGSALMKNPDLAQKIIQAATSLNVPITVKCRLGWDENSINVVEFAQMCEKAGASALTIHARTRSQYYSGKADWTWIKKVKNKVSIPVIANGDVWQENDAWELKQLTNSDGIATARGMLGKPWFLNQLEHFLQRQKKKKNFSLEQKLNFVLEHAELLTKSKGQKKALLEFRKHYLWYVKGLPHIKLFKEQIIKITSLEDIKNTNKIIIATCSQTKSNFII